MNARGIETPIAIFAPLDTCEDEEGSGLDLPVSKGEEFDVRLAWAASKERI